MPQTTDNQQDILISAIGRIRSPFSEKFGIPRQANLIHSAQAEIELYAPYNDPKASLGLESFSHIWLTFGFHLNTEDRWRPMIRPPRLGGNKRIGVFASRSPFRPNALGQSLVELREIIIKDNQAKLVIACPDLIDGTPIYDIKPYINYADSTHKSYSAYADEQPKPTLDIQTSDSFDDAILRHQAQYPNDLGALIKEVISYDPRPAYKRNKEDEKVYKLKLYDLDISFTVKANMALLTDIEKVR
jgi:tRNA-Thr(GGU) m(6)t(6)A37 methyltransferase TsaA